MLSYVNAWQQKFGIPEQSRGIKAHPPCMTVKMVATALALHSSQKRPNSSF